MSTIYLDYAATTPLDPQVFSAMTPFLLEQFGNPSTLYTQGQQAHLGLNGARKMISNILGCQMEEVFFTSGATESIHTAVRGLAHGQKDRGRHIITSSIEHSATLNACKVLEQEGFEVTYLTPTNEGIITKDIVEKALRQETILVSLMYVNNELGSISPIPEIGRLLESKHIAFHVDGVQAPNILPLSVSHLHATALTLSGHKIYGPKGIGALYINKEYSCIPLIPGTQEFGMRGGTQHVAGAVGLAHALSYADTSRTERLAHLDTLQTHLLTELPKLLSDWQLNGTPQGDSHSPAITNISIGGISGTTLQLRLDVDGISIATGSACTSEKKDPSHVLLGIGKSHESAQGSIRISFSHHTTKDEIDTFLPLLAYHVAQIRHLNITYS